jgi:NADPH:quinone reductase-like Zn-dependent oxidoreductase
VVAAGTNPVDAKFRAAGGSRGLEAPVILGSDVSGVVEEAGAGVMDLAPGDEVYYTRQDTAEVALDDTGGTGVDVVLETVGGETVVNSIPATRPFGRLATILRERSNRVSGVEDTASGANELAKTLAEPTPPVLTTEWVPTGWTKTQSGFVVPAQLANNTEKP